MEIIVADTIADQIRERVAALDPSIELLIVAADGQTSSDLSRAAVLFREGIGRAGYDRLLKAAPGLRWIHTGSAGVEHWIADELTTRAITLTNSAGVYGVPIAEWVLHALLMIVKRGPEMVAAQQARRWAADVPFDELTDKTLTILGAGGIGAEIARRAAAFDLRIWGVNRSGQPTPHVARTVKVDTWRELLPETDFLVLAAPLTEATRHIVGAQELALLPSHAWLINIARGALVDEPALIAALEDGVIAGAALDTFEREPLPPDSPLWTLPNVIVSPHHSGTSPRSAERVFALFLDNLARFIRGDELRNVVDLAAGY